MPQGRMPDGTFMSSGLDVGSALNIPVSIVFGVEGAEEAKKEILDVTNATKGAGGEVAKSNEEVKKDVALRAQQTSAMRSVTWDMMLMGRSLSILNSTFLGSNKSVKEAIGLLYGVSAIMRIFLVLRDTQKALSLFMGPAIAAETAATGANTLGNLANAASIRAVTAAKKAELAFSGPVGWAELGVGYAASAAAGIPGAASGGYVAGTGMAIIHQGETIIPKGVGMTMININMQTGGISNGVDVSNMLDAMAGRMALESRRRTGK